MRKRFILLGAVLAVASIAAYEESDYDRKQAINLEKSQCPPTHAGSSGGYVKDIDGNDLISPVIVPGKFEQGTTYKYCLLNDGFTRAVIFNPDGEHICTHTENHRGKGISFDFKTARCPQ